MTMLTDHNLITCEDMQVLRDSLERARDARHDEATALAMHKVNIYFQAARVIHRQDTGCEVHH